MTEFRISGRESLFNHDEQRQSYESIFRVHGYYFFLDGMVLSCIELPRNLGGASEVPRTASEYDASQSPFPRTEALGFLSSLPTISVIVLFSESRFLLADKPI